MHALSYSLNSDNDNDPFYKSISNFIKGIPIPIGIPILIIYIICRNIPYILKYTSEINKDLATITLICAGILIAICVLIICFFIISPVNIAKSERISREIEEKSKKKDKENKTISDKIRDELESDKGEKESDGENQE